MNMLDCLLLLNKIGRMFEQLEKKNIYCRRCIHIGGLSSLNGIERFVHFSIVEQNWEASMGGCILTKNDGYGCILKTHMKS
jgi:hypothetical protein